MEGHPFLISKNPAGADWTGVVVPSFVNDREARRVLLEAQRGDELDSDQAIYVQGNHSTLGVLDLVFRRGNEIHTDGEGRPFRVCEGFVLRKRDRRFRFCAEHLNAAHEALAPLLHAFWTQTTWTERQAASNIVVDFRTVRGVTPLRMIVRSIGKVEAEATHSPNSIPSLGNPPKQLETSLTRTTSRADPQIADPSKRTTSHEDTQKGNGFRFPFSLGGDERAAFAVLSLAFTLIVLAVLGPSGTAVLFGFVGAIASALGLVILARCARTRN